MPHLHTWFLNKFLVTVFTVTTVLENAFNKNYLRQPSTDWTLTLSVVFR